MNYPASYLAFFEKFRAGEYYECHDLLEELWMEEKSNKFLQGLLQVAVGMYHLECGNIKGARWMFGNAQKYLSRYGARHWGLTLQPLLDDLQQALDTLPDVDRMDYEEVKLLAFPQIRMQLDTEENQ